MFSVPVGNHWRSCRGKWRCVRKAEWRRPHCSTEKPGGVLPPESGLRQCALGRFADLPCYGTVLQCCPPSTRAALLAGGAGFHTPPVLQMPTMLMCSGRWSPALMKTTHPFHVLRISPGVRTKKFWWSGVCKVFVYFLVMADKASFTWLNPVSSSFTSVRLPPTTDLRLPMTSFCPESHQVWSKGLAQAGQKFSYWETQGLGFFSQSQELKEVLPR